MNPASRVRKGIIRHLLPVLALAWCVSSPPVRAAAMDLDGIVAIVNDDVIMRTELEDRMRTVEGQLQQQGTAMPPRAVLERQVLDRLILTKLQTQMASHTGIRVDDETLNRTISNIAAENKVSLEQFRNILEEDGYSYQRFREEIRDEILITRLRQRQVDNRVFVTDREIDNFLANQQQQGEGEIEYHLRHILVSVPESPSAKELADAQARAEKVLKDLQGGADFAQLAASYSQGQQALEGGDLGWLKAGQIPSLFAGIVTHMGPGEISELVRSPSGFHIVKLEGTRDTQTHVVTQTHARHILIRPDEVVTEDDARRRLEQLVIRIRGGDDFAELAKGNSNDTVSAAKGGDLGWVSPGDLVPAFEQVMETLQPGQVSEPFETEFGWHIVQVLERREHDDTEQLRRSRAREAIRKRKLEEARDIWLREMRDEAYVEYRLES